MIVSVLEFFQPKQGESIVPEVLNMFDARCPIPPLPAHILSEHGLGLVEKAEALELLAIVQMQSHPFLQSLDPSFLHLLFENVYGAAATQWTPVTDMSLSLYQMILALGHLLSVAHHRRYGCEQAISKACVDSCSAMFNLIFV